MPKRWGKLYFLLLKVKIRNWIGELSGGCLRTPWNARHHPEGFGFFSRASWEENSPGSSPGIREAPSPGELGPIQALQQARVISETPGEMDRNGYLHRAAGQRWSQNCCWQGSMLYTCKSALGCQGSGRLEGHCLLPPVDSNCMSHSFLLSPQSMSVWHCRCYSQMSLNSE